VNGFVARVYRNGRQDMPFRLFIPPSYDAQKKYPIVIWLHGGGGAGRDNLRQIQHDQVPGTRTWTTPASQSRHPAFVLAPQSSIGWAAQPKARRSDMLSAPLLLVLETLDALSREFNLDPDRVYLAGQSDGAYGVWDLVTKRADRFAAAIPISGGGDPREASRAAKVPIWAFHGDDDLTINVMESRRMISALQNAGGDPRYTEYMDRGHDIWPTVFAEPDLADWLFAQHK